MSCGCRDVQWTSADAACGDEGGESDAAFALKDHQPGSSRATALGVVVTQTPPGET